VVLGSATPSLESFHNALSGKYELCRLTHRVDHRAMPVMRVVDLRMPGKSGKQGILSDDLYEAVKDRLARAEQTIIFLNRRGFSTSLVCPACGYVAECRDCSVAMTFHKKDGTLRCHICGAAEAVPARCPAPDCGDPRFRFSGTGTQRVEEIVRRAFKGARVERVDSDTMTRKDAYQRVLGDFRTGKIDILIGTQMIAKGLHFPNVTLVGVVLADLSLHIPDFRAGERTFQLLTQVAGRAGRGDISGEVLVQTYTPFHTVIQMARRLDYEGFVDQELEFRKELGYPPFGHLVCITMRGASEEKVAFSAQSLYKALKPELDERVFIGESGPAPLARAKGHFRYQILLRAPATKLMTEPLRKLLDTFRWPDKVTCTVDVDALSLL
jgi:primosomal protein N' (replication factor Y)